MRIFLGVLAAFMVTGALSTGVDHIFHVTNIYPPYGEPMFNTGLLVLASTYRIAFQILGAYVACLIAQDKAKTAVWIIGVLGAILWLAGTYANKDFGPMWYGVLGAVLSIPSVLVGLKLYEKKSKS